MSLFILANCNILGKYHIKYYDTYTILYKDITCEEGAKLRRKLENPYKNRSSIHMSECVAIFSLHIKNAFLPTKQSNMYLRYICKKIFM